MIRANTEGNFDKTTNALERMMRGELFRALDSFGRAGRDALAGNTPVDTGLSASSWGYDISLKPLPTIAWYNNNTTYQGTPIVILLQYGHATGTGGYVHGYDFINPAIRPIFDQIADDVWEQVRNA